MSPQLNFYRERASEASRDAAAAKLDNVRERCLRAEEAWLGMAARVERSERLRADSAALKSAAAMPTVMILEEDPVEEVELVD